MVVAEALVVMIESQVFNVALVLILVQGLLSVDGIFKLSPSHVPLLVIKVRETQIIISRRLSGGCCILCHLN